MEEGLIQDLSGEIEENSNMYSPLTLAFIGDGVYELFIRTQIIKHTNAPANQLHRRCVKYVRAQGQCEALDRIQPLLTEEEISAAGWGVTDDIRYPIRGGYWVNREMAGIQAYGFYMRNKDRYFDVGFRCCYIEESDEAE